MRPPTSNATPTHSRIVPFYRALMGELRDRFRWIEHALNGRMGVPKTLIEEFVFLQIRLCCEIIALSCVVAHGDIEKARAKRIVKKWSATEIFIELEKLTPDFYPKPLVQEPETFHIAGEVSTGWHFADRGIDFMTKGELVAHYGRCGDRLHRGNPKSILSNKPYKQNELTELAGIVQKLINLVACHRIQLVGEEAQLLCVMFPGDSDEVSVVLGYPVDESGERLPSGQKHQPRPQVPPPSARPPKGTSA